MSEFKIAETFVSINGEGRHAGQLAVFIRFQGCNLNCRYCDTKWANNCNAPYTVMTENEIYDYIKSTGIIRVTITGGEPLIQPDIEVLLHKLAEDMQLMVEIETNGSINISKAKLETNSPSLTVDYKLSASGMEDMMCLDNFSLIDKNDTVKFVAGSIADLEKAESIVKKYKLIKKCSVYFSPVFESIEPESIVEYMKAHALNGIYMQLQMHKFIWEPHKRGV